MRQALPDESIRQRKSRAYTPSSEHFSASHTLVDNRDPTAIQRQLIANMSRSALQRARKSTLLQGHPRETHKCSPVVQKVVQLFAAYYAWGAANTTPHVHVYNSGMHLKSAGGHRYNIVQNNARHF